MQNKRKICLAKPLEFWGPNYKFEQFFVKTQVAPCKGNRIPESSKVFACGTWNPGRFELENLKSWALESGIQLKESGIQVPLMKNRAETGAWIPESTDCLGLPYMR